MIPELVWLPTNDLMEAGGNDSTAQPLPSSAMLLGLPGTGAPAHLSLSFDETVLSVCRGPSILLYDVAALVRSGKGLTAVIPTPKGDAPVAVVWNPGHPDAPERHGLVVVVYASGKLEQRDMKLGGKVLKVADAKDHTGASWSPKGKQVVASRRCGALTFYGSALSVKREIPAPDSMPGAQALGVEWVCASQFLVPFLYKDAVTMWNAVTGKNAERKSTHAYYTWGEEAFYPPFEENFVQRCVLLGAKVPSTNSVVMGVSFCPDIKVFGPKSAEKPAHLELYTFVQEEFEMQTPPGDDGDSYPVGMGLDLTDMHSPPPREDAPDEPVGPPCPRLICLTSDGDALVYTLVSSLTSPSTARPRVYSSSGSTAILDQLRSSYPSPWKEDSVKPPQRPSPKKKETPPRASMWDEKAKPSPPPPARMPAPRPQPTQPSMESMWKDVGSTPTAQPKRTPLRPSVRPPVVPKATPKPAKKEETKRKEEEPKKKEEEEVPSHLLPNGHHKLETAFLDQIHSMDTLLDDLQKKADHVDSILSAVQEQGSKAPFSDSSIAHLEREILAWEPKVKDLAEWTTHQRTSVYNCRSQFMALLRQLEEAHSLATMRGDDEWKRLMESRGLDPESQRMQRTIDGLMRDRSNRLSELSGHADALYAAQLRKKKKEVEREATPTMATILRTLQTHYQVAMHHAHEMERAEEMLRALQSGRHPKKKKSTSMLSPRREDAPLYFSPLRRTPSSVTPGWDPGHEDPNSRRSRLISIREALEERLRDGPRQVVASMGSVVTPEKETLASRPMGAPTLALEEEEPRKPRSTMVALDTAMEDRPEEEELPARFSFTDGDVRMFGTEAEAEALKEEVVEKETKAIVQSSVVKGAKVEEGLFSTPGGSATEGEGGLFGGFGGASDGGKGGLFPADEEAEEAIYGDDDFFGKGDDSAKADSEGDGYFGKENEELDGKKGGLFGELKEEAGEKKEEEAGLFGAEKKEESDDKKEESPGLFGEKKEESPGLFGEKKEEDAGLFGAEKKEEDTGLFGDDKREESDDKKEESPGLFGEKKEEDTGLFGDDKREESDDKKEESPGLFGEKKEEDAGLFGAEKKEEDTGLFGDDKREESDDKKEESPGLFGDDKKEESPGLFGEKKEEDAGLFGAEKKEESPRLFGDDENEPGEIRDEQPGIPRMGKSGEFSPEVMFGSKQEEGGLFGGGSGWGSGTQGQWDDEEEDKPTSKWEGSGSGSWGGQGGGGLDTFGSSMNKGMGSIGDEPTSWGGEGGFSSACGGGKSGVKSGNSSWGGDSGGFSSACGGGKQQSSWGGGGDSGGFSTACGGGQSKSTSSWGGGDSMFGGGGESDWTQRKAKEEEESWGSGGGLSGSSGDAFQDLGKSVTSDDAWSDSNTGPGGGWGSGGCGGMWG